MSSFLEHSQGRSWPRVQRSGPPVTTRLACRDFHKSVEKVLTYWVPPPPESWCKMCSIFWTHVVKNSWLRPRTHCSRQCLRVRRVVRLCPGGTDGKSRGVDASTSGAACACRRLCTTRAVQETRQRYWGVGRLLRNVQIAVAQPADRDNSLPIECDDILSDVTNNIPLHQHAL